MKKRETSLYLLKRVAEKIKNNEILKNIGNKDESHQPPQGPDHSIC